MGSTKYIFSMGELTRKDNSLCFRKDEKNVYIPIENTKEIYCMNEVSINTKLLDFLGQNHVVIHFFNYYGGYSGTFYPRAQYMSGRLLIKQVESFKQNRMSIAKAVVKGIGSNIYEVLYHYYKHDKKEVKGTVDWIKKEFYADVEHAEHIKALLAVEGELWMRFYADFRYFLPEDFIMNKRVKRPPDNPMNALVSFGNTLLYTKTISAIYRTHLDQRISYLHEPSEARFSLSLDLSESFRMESVFQHPLLKRKVSYRTAIKLDCYKLIKQIMEEKEFIPFSLKGGY